MLQFTHLNEECNILHFMTTRYGGNSNGNYHSFNLSQYSGDNPSNVAHNRNLLCSALDIPPDNLFIPCQIHEDKVAIINSSFLSLPGKQQENELNGIDALLTNEPDIAIAVATADCVPLLLYSPDVKVIAAVHAGWRGTVRQIAAKTIRLMKEKFNCDVKLMKAGIGPSIGIEAFEVGDNVIEAFRVAGTDISNAYKYNHATRKMHIDLWTLNYNQLIEVGVEPDHIEISGICTYTHCDDFFSARRLGIHSGRMLSGIMIKN